MTMALSNPSKEIIKELKKQNKQQWHLIISRPGIPPLQFSVGMYSSARLNKILGTDWTIENHKWQEHKFYISENDKQKVLRFLEKKLEKDKKFLLDILGQGKKQCDKLIKEAGHYEKDYYKYFNKIFEIQKNTALYFRIVLKIEILLQKKFPKIKFLQPTELNYIMKFHNDLIRLKDVIQKGKEPAKEIKKVVQKYRWLTIFHYTGEFLTVRDIKGKINHLLKKEEVVKKVPATSENKDIKIYRDVIFLRTHLAESFSYSNAKAKPILEKIAENYGITYSDITHLTADELLESLKNKKLIVPKNEINSRKKRFGLFLHKKRVYILNKEQCDEIFGNETVIEEKTKILKGTSASPGKVRGEVCMIKDFTDFSKFKPNNILAAYSTTPNYIILMHMAKAFLTQEGGITSHAAIVAREMKKPCVVGIKNLMQELKDGEIIEVNATKGIVKRIT
jgi:phosphohistidine swiveling domain-containing protein